MYVLCTYILQHLIEAKVVTAVDFPFLDVDAQINATLATETAVLQLGEDEYRRAASLCATRENASKVKAMLTENLPFDGCNSRTARLTVNSLFMRMMYDGNPRLVLTGVMRSARDASIKQRDGIPLTAEQKLALDKMKRYSHTAVARSGVKGVTRDNVPTGVGIICKSDTAPDISTFSSSSSSSTAETFTVRVDKTADDASVEKVHSLIRNRQGTSLHGLGNHNVAVFKNIISEGVSGVEEQHIPESEGVFGILEYPDDDDSTFTVFVEANAPNASVIEVASLVSNGLGFSVACKKQSISGVLSAGVAGVAQIHVPSGVGITATIEPGSATYKVTVAADAPQVSKELLYGLITAGLGGSIQASSNAQQPRAITPSMVAQRQGAAESKKRNRVIKNQENENSAVMKKLLFTYEINGTTRKYESESFFLDGKEQFSVSKNNTEFREVIQQVRELLGMKKLSDGQWKIPLNLVREKFSGICEVVDCQGVTGGGAPLEDDDESVVVELDEEERNNDEDQGSEGDDRKGRE